MNRDPSPTPEPIPATATPTSGASEPADSTVAGPTPRETLVATLRQLGPAGPLAIAVTILPPIGSLILIAVATTTDLGPWMRSHSSVALPLYVLAFWVLGICCLPTYAYSVLGGYAFGFVNGTIAAALAYAGACVAGFAVAQWLARDRVVPLIERYPKLAAVRHVLADASFGRSLLVIALIRISPASPFAISNVVLGASGVRWPAFLLGSLIGVVPRTVAVIWIASRMSTLSFGSGADGGVDDRARIATYVVTALGVLATVAVIGVIGRLARIELDRQLATKLNPGRPSPE